MTNLFLPTSALGIGDAMVDLFTRASQLPPRGGNIWSSAVEMHPGGTTANVSANLAKLGILSAFAGCVGDDPYGSYIIDEFKRIGVETSLIKVINGTYTGIVLAVIDDSGERTFIACAKGAAHINFSNDFAKGLVFTKNQLVHSSGVCLVEEPARSGLITALHKASENGNSIYFDPNLRLEGDTFLEGLKTAQWKAIALSEVVLIGDDELRLLCPETSISQGAKIILDAGPKLVVVKQGGDGASAFSHDTEEHIPAFKVDVVSTAGAGDSFDAGFIAARFRQANVRDALVYANAVAAIKVSRHGSQSVPSHQEVMEFIGAQGYTIKMNEF